MEEQLPSPTSKPPPDPLTDYANRFNVNESIDSTKIGDRGYGSLLLYYREAIFDKIYRSENLNGMIRHYLQWSLIFCAIFGAFLGFFSLDLQILSSAFKVPLMVWGTLLICLPALYTFNVLLGSKLSILQTLAVLSMSTYLLSTVLVSLAPIILFFILSVTEEPFITLLVVIACSISGLFSVLLLWNAMGYLTIRSGYTYDSRIIKTWTLIYAFVGTQFAWLLRPFIGTMGEFAWVRDVGGNFYNGLYKIILNLFT